MFFINGHFSVNCPYTALNLPEDKTVGAPASVYTVKTEVWVWGRNTRGQLGLGDMLDRYWPNAWCATDLSTAKSFEHLDKFYF